MSLKIINQATLKQLAQDGVLNSVTVIAKGDKWELLVNYGQVEKMLATTNSHKIRTWSKLDTLSAYLNNLGICYFKTDTTGRTLTNSTKVKRPDRADALKKAHSAVEHDAWFRQQVEQGLQEADDSQAIWLSHDEATKEMYDWRQVMAKKHGIQI